MKAELGSVLESCISDEEMHYINKCFNCDRDEEEVYIPSGSDYCIECIKELGLDKEEKFDERQV